MKAFPRADGKFDSSKADEQGMDLRDYFAAKIMQSLIIKFNENSLEWNAYEEADIAYQIADAMMKAREQHDK